MLLFHASLCSIVTAMMWRRQQSIIPNRTCLADDLFRTERSPISERVNVQAKAAARLGVTIIHLEAVVVRYLVPKSVSLSFKR